MAGRVPENPDGVVNEDEVLEEFPRGDNRPLAEQVPLEDETGADVREYTGEPVDTGDGVVIPQQQNVGEERTVGDGEFHDDDEQEVGP
jgi:hypothetical protein